MSGCRAPDRPAASPRPGGPAVPAWCGAGRCPPPGRPPVAGVSGRSRAGAVRSETRAAVTASKAGRFSGHRRRRGGGPDPRPRPGVLNRVSIIQRPPYRSGTVAANTASASPSAGRSVVGSGRCGGSPPSSGGPVPVAGTAHPQRGGDPGEGDARQDGAETGIRVKERDWTGQVCGSDRVRIRPSGWVNRPNSRSTRSALSSYFFERNPLI